MSLETSLEQEDPELEFVEVDPTGRYGRYKEILGKGAFKKVYRAFDELEGIEVAWNQVKVSELLRNSEDLERLYSEVHLLKTLKHKNIIKFYNSWVDTKNEHINFITEIFTSGTLRQYRKKHKHVDLRALKKWSRQILEGLLHLHSHDPPIIHRDLKCDNIFVNGNHGEVKIGDLGLAAILQHANAAHSVIGTPEFMAPELYEEEYNELVDIYAFGMCLLELVTFEYPYTECSNAAQIYKKVTSGIKPASLTKVTDPDVKAFVEKCIANVSERLSARELLRDDFLSDVDREGIGRSLHGNVQHSNSGSVIAHDESHIRRNSLENSDPEPSTSRDLTVYGERKDVNTIFIKLRIADSTGHYRNIHFPFDIEADTSIAVASEMVHELVLMDQDIPTIADMIDSEIRALIPYWSPRDSSEDDYDFNSHASKSKDDLSPLYVSENKDDTSPLTSASPFSSSNFFEDQLSSGRKFWSDSPWIGVGLSPIKPNHEGSSVIHLSDNLRNDSSNEEKTDEVAHECQTTEVGWNWIEDKVLDTNFEDKSRRCGFSPTSSSNFHLEVSEEKTDEASHEGAITKDNLMEDKDKAYDDTLSNQNFEDKPICEEGSNSKKEDIIISPFQNDECNNKYLDGHRGSMMDELQEKGGLLELKFIIEKLNKLLIEQQKQLDELKWKHKLAISDILKGLSPQTRLKVFKMCSMKIADYKSCCEIRLCCEHVTELGSCKMSFQVPSIVMNNKVSNCSSASAKRILTRTSSTLDLSSPRILNSFKQESTSEMGIAVILRDEEKL